MRNNSAPEESPDIFSPPRKGPGGKKLNRLPVVGIAIIGCLFLAVVVYTADKRSHAHDKKENESMENYAPSGPAESPVTRPPGPDVDPVQVIQTAPYAPVNASAPAIVSPVMSEAERKIMEKRAAILEAAITSSQVVENSTSRRQPLPQQGMVPPNVPGYSMPSSPSQTRNVDSEYGDLGGMDNQSQKRAFLKESVDPNDSPYLKHTRMPALSPYQINPGDVIPGEMITWINSDLPGYIIGLVSRNVYDSATGLFVLIPAGAKIFGVYDSSVSAGQERALVAWNDIEFPDGSHISLGSMPGADKSGIAGLHDRVDNHYLRTFGQAFMLSLFTAASQLSQTRGGASGNYSASQIMAAAVGMQGFNLGSQLIRRNLNIQSTLEVRPGTEFTVMITKKMVFPGPWMGHPLASKTSSLK